MLSRVVSQSTIRGAFRTDATFKSSRICSDADQPDVWIHQSPASFFSNQDVSRISLSALESELKIPGAMPNRRESSKDIQVASEEVDLP